MEQSIQIFEVVNQTHYICPDCGVYRGQYHSPDCLVVHELSLREERANQEENTLFD